MRADRLIGRAYADLIFQVLETNAKPMRCKEISKEISEHSDFPKLSPQYVRAQMNYMLHRGEIVRIEEHTPYSKRKTVYFDLPPVVEEVKDEDEDMEDVKITLDDKSSLIEDIAGGVTAFTIGEDGKMTKIFVGRGK
jgi:hypothetical protein